jgi:UTP--glucose-1-phosphate uridylyltransferase
MHVRQGEAKGLGHAVLCALPLVGEHPFAVVLPDVLIDHYDSNLKTENLAEMIARFNQTGASQVMVEPVPEQQVSAYGIVDLSNEQIKAGESQAIKSIVEKPDVDSAPSNLAVVGRYVFSAAIWNLLKRTPAGAGDEIQLTDAIEMLIHKEKVDAYHIRGRSHDCGNKIGYMNAFVEYGLRDPDLKTEFAKNLKVLINKYQ